MTKRSRRNNNDDKAKQKKTKDRCPADEALLGIDIIENGSKVRVRLAEGWEGVLPQKGDDDPGCLIMWDDDNIEATVASFNAAIAAGAAPPGWFDVGVGPKPVTIPGLKASILAHVQGTGGGGGVVGNAMIAPNTVEQFSGVTSVFGYIGVEPFFIQHAQCPIGRHYVFADRRNNATATACPIVAPPAGLGVPVFA